MHKPPLVGYEETALGHLTSSLGVWTSHQLGSVDRSGRKCALRECMHGWSTRLI